MLWFWQRVLPTWSDAARRASVVKQSIAMVLGLAGVLALNHFAYGLGVPADDGSTTYRVLAYPWYVPLGSTVAFMFALLLRPPEVTREGSPGRGRRGRSTRNSHLHPFW